MIDNPKFFGESLLVPHSYKNIFKKINSNLYESNYDVICNNYKSKLDNSCSGDAPMLKEFTNYDSSNFLANTIFLKQAQNFANLGKTSIIAVKPLLLYNAEIQLFTFFINTLFHFNNSTEGHGLKFLGSNYDDIGVKVEKYGFFQRIINTYSVLGNSWIFSPYERGTNKEFKKTGEGFDFVKTPDLKIRKLIEFKNSPEPGQPEYYLDQIDFVLLFLSFSLARYKPSIWHSIVNGEFGDEIIFFKQTFNRFEKLSSRLIDTLYSIYQGKFLQFNKK